MVPTPRIRLVVLASAAVSAVGLLDAIVSAEEDFVAVFALLAVLQLLLLWRIGIGRRPIPLRPDLAGWLIDRATATGEPVERIADRAVAAYRAGLGEPAP